MESPLWPRLGGHFFGASDWPEMSKAAAIIGQSAMYGTISKFFLGLVLVSIGAVLVAADETMTPLQRVESTPTGNLRSPYINYASVAEEGHKIYLAHDCGSCHGGGGGGGMAAPLTNEVWIYGVPMTRCSG
jgi:hypothetical protein